MFLKTCFASLSGYSHLMFFHMSLMSCSYAIINFIFQLILYLVFKLFVLLDTIHMKMTHFLCKRRIMVGTYNPNVSLLVCIIGSANKCICKHLGLRLFSQLPGTGRVNDISNKHESADVGCRSSSFSSII